jgi:hypothetical protein
MSPEVKYCFEDEDVAHVAENMAELQVRRLPVMNRDKRLVGIVSVADLAFGGSLPKTARALHGISQPGGAHNQSRSSGTRDRTRSAAPCRGTRLPRSVHGPRRHGIGRHGSQRHAMPSTRAMGALIEGHPDSTRRGGHPHQSGSATGEERQWHRAITGVERKKSPRRPASSWAPRRDAPA